MGQGGETMTMLQKATAGLLFGSVVMLAGCAAQQPAPIDPAVMARIEAAANKAEAAANKAEAAANSAADAAQRAEAAANKAEAIFAKGLHK
jgi:hypothetical protein